LAVGRFGLTFYPVPNILIVNYEPDIAAGQAGAKTPPISHYQVKMTC
jgi:hypothetical protein